MASSTKENAPAVEDAPAVKKTARTRASTDLMTTRAVARKSVRKAGTAVKPASKRKGPRRPVAAEAQGDIFDEGSVMSPRIRREQLRSNSMVLASTAGESELLTVKVPAAPQPVSRSHDWLLLFVILLLVAASFCLGRFTSHPIGAPVDFQSQAPASGTATASGATPAAPDAAVTSVSAARSAVIKPKPGIASAVAASIKADVAAFRRVDTSLQEVSVGTSSQGGITLKFDRPVSWTVHDNGGRGEAEVDIAGVHDLRTFPRNLPLPPGVMVIHAAVTGPDTLRLWFTLLPNLKIFSAPAAGPSQSLNVYFRADAEPGAVPTAAPAARTAAAPVTQG